MRINRNIRKYSMAPDSTNDTHLYSTKMFKEINSGYFILML